MTEPWKPDLTALGERTRTGLAPLPATRAAVANRLAPKERPMRLFKRPVLATLIILAVALITVPVAYAIVDRIVLRVDPHKSAPEIERDVQRQLEAAGVPATVRADKSDGRVQVSIATSDPGAARDLTVDVAGSGSAQQESGSLNLQVTCALTDAQRQRLVAASSSPAMIDALTSTAPAAERIAAIRAAMAAAGFHDTTASVDGTSVTVTVAAPPR